VRQVGLCFLLFARSAAAQQECRPCHARIYDTYQRTGMARSFGKVQTPPVTEGFDHPASDTRYSQFQRDDRYYQRRWQTGYKGLAENGEQLPVDYVIGSGNHAQTWLSKTSRGTLIELPLGWYAENGGTWGMNPGYDVAHPPAGREISYECMFCHNAYPKTPTGHENVFSGELPAGINCERCHGPGAKHLQAGGAGGIVNPARLTKERQLEVCMQCHLETTSTRLPSLIRRFDRPPFSYVPGEPLGDFVLSFDHMPAAGYDDKFEIAGGAYRLRKSQCFLQSKGEMTCTTCHNPHDIPRGEEATKAYAAACRGCHTNLKASADHTPAADCVACHMPKRYTDDAVHVAITDHFIQRRPAERHPAQVETYRGEVVPYYPAAVPPLYEALAQVLHGANMEPGIERLTTLLGQAPDPDGWMALGDAYHQTRQPLLAAQAYAQAAKLRPNSGRDLRFYGIALHEAGQIPQATDALHRALRLSPEDPHAWFELAVIDSEQGHYKEAVAQLRKAIALNPGLPDFHNSLGANLAASGVPGEAERAYREALRIDPWHAAAHANLARLLAALGDREQAIYYFEKANRLQPGNAPNLYEHALTLVQLNRFDDSQRQAEAAIAADPNLAEAHELLGGLHSRKSEPNLALPEFETAVRLKPGFSRAQLDLGVTMATQGDTNRAIPHLREAARGSDQRVAQQAARALQQLGVAP
jgi:predicted CXXCH cytochrome family protein